MVPQLLKDTFLDDNYNDRPNHFATLVAHPMSVSVICKPAAHLKQRCNSNMPAKARIQSAKVSNGSDSSADYKFKNVDGLPRIVKPRVKQRVKKQILERIYSPSRSVSRNSAKSHQSVEPPKVQNFLYRVNREIV